MSAVAHTESPASPAASERPHGFFARLAAFAANVFEPKLHTAFAAAWSLSLFGNLHIVGEGGHAARTVRWDASLVVLVATVFACLFALRMVDEVKDYAYDVVHNPQRPLVAGLVTRRDIARYVALLAVIVLALNAAIAAPLAAWVALDLAYGLAQIPLERRSRTVRDNLLCNLIAVYPVNVGLSAYTLLFFHERTGAPLEAAHAWLVVAYACAFLHFEFARKSGWPHLAKAGERLYSEQLGLVGSLAVSTLFGIAALALVLGLLAPWSHSGARAAFGYAPLLAAVPMLVGLVKFARHRHHRHAARPPAVAFLFAFYLTLLAHTVYVACALSEAS